MGIPYSELSPMPTVDPFAADQPMVAVRLGANNYETPLRTIAAAGSGSTTATQAGHTFIVGDAVYKAASGLYVLAVASGALTGEAVGIVTSLGSGDQFTVTHAGLATLVTTSGNRYTAPFTPGLVYYLSSTTAGLGVTQRPLAAGSLVKPLFITVDAGQILVIDDRVAPTSTVVDATVSGESISGLKIGDAVYRNGSIYSKAIDSGDGSVTAVGIVTAIQGSTAQVTFAGVADIGNVGGGTYTSALTPGASYCLSTTTAGLCEIVAGAVDEYRVPVFVALSTTRVAITGLGRPRVANVTYLDVVQSSPALKVGHAVYFDGSAWQLGSSASQSQAQTAGIVSRKSGTAYRITLCGKVTIVGADTAVFAYNSALTPGSVYYLSTTPGIAATDQTSKPAFIAISTTAVIICPDRPNQSYTGPSYLVTPVLVYCPPIQKAAAEAASATPSNGEYLPPYISVTSPMSTENKLEMPPTQFNAVTLGVPSGAKSVILDAQAASTGANGYTGYTSLYVLTGASSPRMLLLSNSAAGGGDSVISAAQGTYPLAGDGTFWLEKRQVGFDRGWFVRIVGYHM